MAKTTRRKRAEPPIQVAAQQQQHWTEAQPQQEAFAGLPGQQLQGEPQSRPYGFGAFGPMRDEFGDALKDSLTAEADGDLIKAFELLTALGPVDKPHPTAQASEHDKAQEAARGFVEAGGDAALLLEMSDAALAARAYRIERSIDRVLHNPVTLGRDLRLGTAISEVTADDRSGLHFGNGLRIYGRRCLRWARMTAENKCLLMRKRLH